MEGSSAPVYVVVKSFAASMAATICTLAEKSFAYPNAVILHHQISSTIMFANLNLTEQKEFYEESQQWWERLAGPLAKKMGITTDEFIKRMYAKTTSGDWTEFGTEAQKIKWVDHIVERIHETSLLKNPDAKKPAPATAYHGLIESTDEKGKPCMYLPRLTPKDCYFLYNKDGYYRMK
jgi:ATP-dependent Clp protease protease subunit